MDRRANPGHVSDDEVRLREISVALASTVDGLVAGWIERLVTERVAAAGQDVTEDVLRAARAAGARAHADLMPRLEALLAVDIDEQRSTPLSLLRDATRHADGVLARLGLPPVARDQFSMRSFPADRYGLVPATWSDVDPSLHEVGITWGAAKAFVHKDRRRGDREPS